MSTKTQETSHNTKIRKKRLNNVARLSKVHENSQYMPDNPGKCHLIHPSACIDRILLNYRPIEAVINGPDLLPLPYGRLKQGRYLLCHLHLLTLAQQQGQMQFLLLQVQLQVYGFLACSLLVPAQSAGDRDIRQDFLPEHIF